MYSAFVSESSMGTICLVVVRSVTSHPFDASNSSNTTNVQTIRSDSKKKSRLRRVHLRQWRNFYLVPGTARWFPSSSTLCTRPDCQHSNQRIPACIYRSACPRRCSGKQSFVSHVKVSTIVPNLPILQMLYFWLIDHILPCPVRLFVFF